MLMVLRWHGGLSVKVYENANLDYSQDKSYF